VSSESAALGAMIYFRRHRKAFPCCRIHLIHLYFTVSAIGVVFCARCRWTKVNALGHVTIFEKCLRDTIFYSCPPSLTTLFLATLSNHTLPGHPLSPTLYSCPLSHQHSTPAHFLTNTLLLPTFSPTLYSCPAPLTTLYSWPPSHHTLTTL